MPKQTNEVIRLAHDGARAISNSVDLSSQDTMIAYDITEALGPIHRRTENERKRLLTANGGDPYQGLVAPEAPGEDAKAEDRAKHTRAMVAYRENLQAFLAEWQPIEQEEVDVPELPTLRLTHEELDAAGIPGSVAGPLRKLGALEIVSEEEKQGPEPKTRAEKRRREKASKKKAAR